MVRDINPGGDSFAQGPDPLRGAPSTSLANDGTNGFELWRIVPEPAAFRTPNERHAPADEPTSASRCGDEIQKLSKRLKKAEDPDVKAKLKKKRRNARNQLAALGCPCQQIEGIRDGAE